MADIQVHADGMAGGKSDDQGNRSSAPNLRNELAESSSPYLRSHKDNLVAWQEWSPKSIALARTQEKPIFLSIGYSACHWCHVMSHESFDSPEIASALNESFVPIKVDRESRPDLDDIYMNYVTATTGSGGWPLNVFLTPDLQPLFGGTYWPSPSSETAMPKPEDANEDKPLNFLDIVQKIRDIWQNERDRCLASAADITHQLQAFSAEGVHAHSSVHVKGVEENDSPEPLDLDLLDDALDHFVSRYDSKFGGFLSGAGSLGPKFPTPANLTFLLRIGASITRPSTHTRFGFPAPVPGILGKTSCTKAATMALHTLQTMSRSALRDHLGHGFHRYSVTPDWNLPHFEKMLCDNAQLLAVYCDSWALARDPEILGTIYDLVDYLTSPESPIVRKEGGWYTSEAADSLPSITTTNDTQQEKKEGAFYVWTLKELQTILGERDGGVLARHFGVTEHGNIPQKYDVQDEFLGQNTLHIEATPSVLAKEFGLKEEEVVKIVKEGKNKLVQYRKSKRAPPEVDDKVVLSYNALAISALARAAHTLASIDESRAKVAIDGAIRGIEFIKATLFDAQTGKLTRIYSDRAGPTEGQNLAFIDDYAFLIQALRTLFDLTFEQHYLDWALQLQTTIDDNFRENNNGGYYQSATTSLASPTPTSDPNPAEQSISTPDARSSSITKPTEQILKLKPGTDNSIPSPNGVIASNLLYLSSYVSALQTTDTASSTTTTSTTLLTTARNTINAFAPEIIQHPFLYASLLSAVVIDTVGVKSMLIPSTSLLSEGDLESLGLRGFGRIVVRSPALKKGEVMICESFDGERGGVCRPMRDGELDELEDGFEGEEAGPEVSPEVIKQRDEMARRESVALERERLGMREEEVVGGDDDRPVVVDVPPKQEV